MFEPDVLEVEQHTSTGRLPSRTRISTLLNEAHERYADNLDGDLADVIPVLSMVDPKLFGIALIEIDGEHHAVGDAEVAFSIQSVSKAFVFALVCEAIGHEAVHERVGVNNTGLPFNSVMAVELNEGHPMNPMVNAGAITTTSLVPGITAAEQWDYIQDGLSRFAGRRLEIDENVYLSERFHNQRNQAIGHLLDSYGRIDTMPEDTVDVYTKQCALSVTAKDLAVMGATLADGGINPITGEQVISPEVCRDTLSVLAACGLYQRSGEWLFEIGIPAKSGVSGGIVAIAPGKGALGVYSPLLDSAGNSVRGQSTCAYLSRALGLNLFASASHRVHGTPTAG
ncbi:MAG: glutaminase A [Leucobacter sp.]